MPAAHSASISTKMLQQLGGVTVVGPLLTGLDKPVQIVPLGAKDSDIVNMAARVSDLNIGGAKTELSFWVRNLTKEDRPTNFIDFGPGFGGLTLGYFPDPRTYGVSVGIKF